MKEFYELDVWKSCRDFKINITKKTKSFPEIEQYRLTHQVIKSVRSVNANISEGHGRYHYKENIQFCRQARASLTETLNHMIDAYDEKYISINELREIKVEYTNCIKLLNGYISFLRKKRDANSTDHRFTDH